MGTSLSRDGAGVEGQEAEKGRGVGTDNLGFVFIDAHARSTGEVIDQWEAGDKRFDIWRGDGEVISRSTCGNVVFLHQFGEERVIAEEKEERGEGAALFHPTEERD